MSSFRFNFLGTPDENEIKEIKTEIDWIASEEVFPTNQAKDLDDLVTQAHMITCHDVEIGHVLATEAISKIDNGFKNVVNSAEAEHSDLVSGKYEGGLKIWECTYDLLNYFVENQEIVKFQNANILDLGCGAGILGIYAFMQGAYVTFQDYNKEVLEHVTIPNILLNIDDEDREKDIKRCKFYSGDWDSFNEKLPNNEVYDFIMTSETIYNDSNYKKLINLFKTRISQNGTIFLAAKSVYFGVGGGIRQFEKLIQDDASLKCETCWKSTDGILREITKINKV